MNVLSIFTRPVLIACLGVQMGFAVAQDDSSIYGTHSVVFQPVQVGGNLQSCTFVYRAVQADYAYLNGDPVVIAGNIAVHQFGSNMILGLKIGVMDLNVPNAPFLPPYFAYLQTENATTSKSRHEDMVGEEGFQLIAIGYDDASAKLFFEMLETGKVTIGFNRKKNGVDVLVPIDLKVYDTEYLNTGEVVRKRSNDAIDSIPAVFQGIIRERFFRNNEVNGDPHISTKVVTESNHVINKVVTLRAPIVHESNTSTS